MFKPSLRKSILNDNLCIESQKKQTLFETSNGVKQRPVYKKQSVGGQSRQIVDVPSMMISQRLLTRTTFEMDHHPDTKVFTPFIYDFKAYPRAVREFIAPNPNAAQAGKCGQINFVIFQKSLFLWIDNGNNKIPMSSPSYTSPSLSASPSHSPSSSQKVSQPFMLLKMHKFSQPIDMAQFSIIKNTRIFTIPKAIVLAIVFKNRMKLFLINQKQLFLEDMMLKYQLKGANRIQHVHFTKNNEILFAGDNGKLSMISLNGNTSQIITVHQSSILARYLSRSAFDYSTVYNIRQITSTDNFIYCLYDRIKKENYLLYVIKKAVNKVVRLEKQPKYIVDETFVDVYKYTNYDNNKYNHQINHCLKNNKRSIILIDRISQQLVQQKIKQGYSQFTGENVKDGFRIVAVRGKSIIKNNRNNLITHDILQKNKHNNFNNDQAKQQMRGQSQQQKNNNDRLRVNDNKQGGYRNSLSNGVMQIVTKCGYVIGVVHHTGDQSLLINQKGQLKHQIDSENISLHSSQQQQRQNTHISFTHQPIKLPSTIGLSNFLEPKLFPSLLLQKSYRKNFVIKAIQSRQESNSNNEEMVLLLSDSLMRISKDGQVNVVRFGDLKVNVMETTIQKEMFITAEQYERKYNKKSRGKTNQQQKLQQHNEPNQSKRLFPHIQKSSKTPTPQQQKYYRLFNHQRRFTSFDNQGRIDIYTLQLRHTILAYISYYLQAKARAQHDHNYSHSTLAMLYSSVDYDSKIQKIFSKIINLYGYCKTIKSLLQILTLNQHQNRQYINFQRSLLIDTLRKQFESQQSQQLSSKSRFQQWNYLLNHHQESLLIVVNDEMLDYVWRMVFEMHLRVPLSIEVVSNNKSVNTIGQSSLWQSTQWISNNYEANNHPTTQTYTAYANAMLSLFNQQLSILSTIRTREFKQQQHIIKSCQSNLIKLYELIEKKKKMFMSYHYRQFDNNIKGYQQQQKQQLKQSFCINKNINDQTTATTTYLLAAGQQQQNDLTNTININNNKTFININRKNNYQTNYSTQSNSIIQQQILTSISKIVTLVDVMSLLIERDQRLVNKVPSLVSVLTQYKSQLRCGELLFGQQLVYLKQGDSYYDNNNKNNTNINRVTFLHPQLIQRVLKILPQLQIDKKIQYLKFKLSRNLITQTSLLNTTINTNMNSYQNNKSLIIDLKSLDLQRLSKLITTSDLPQLNKIFLLSNNSNHQQLSKQFTLQRAEYYIEFLTICLTNFIAKTNYLVDIKQSKFNTLSQQVKTTTTLQQQTKSTGSLLTNYYSVEKIIMVEQKLSHYQTQMIVFYQQVVKVFKSCVQYLAKVTGHEYYSAQKYLQRIIEMLVCAFPNEEVLIQTIMIILKDANLIDKVQYVRTTRSKLDLSHKTKRLFVDLSKQKQARLTEKSTFEYLLNNRNKNIVKNNHDNTIDTL